MPILPVKRQFILIDLKAKLKERHTSSSLNVNAYNTDLLLSVPIFVFAFAVKERRKSMSIKAWTRMCRRKAKSLIYTL